LSNNEDLGEITMETAALPKLALNTHEIEKNIDKYLTRCLKSCKIGTHFTTKY